jgi:hypothetical protein
LIASSSVVLANLAYLLGAVVLAVIGGTVVWLRHRQPKSVDANVRSFNRGLRALAPEHVAGLGPQNVATEAPAAAPRPAGVRMIRATDDEASDASGVDPRIDLTVDAAAADVRDETGTEEVAGERAGAESG